MAGFHSVSIEQSVAKLAVKPVSIAYMLRFPPHERHSWSLHWTLCMYLASKQNLLYSEAEETEIPYVYIWWTVRVGHAQRGCVTVATLSLLSETGHGVARLCGLLSAHCPLSDCCGRRHCIVGCHACQMDCYGPVFSKPRTVEPTVVTEK